MFLWVNRRLVSWEVGNACGLQITNLKFFYATGSNELSNIYIILT